MGWDVNKKTEIEVGFTNIQRERKGWKFRGSGQKKRRVR
jgi:hypothetical protein